MASLLRKDVELLDKKVPIERASLSDLFGALKKRPTHKGKPMTGQEFKDMVREGWD